MPNTYQQVIDTLSPCRRVLITTHVRPDGDALGSAAAMHLALSQKGIRSDVLLLSHLPRKYRFSFEDSPIPYRDVESRWGDFSIDLYDALLVVDTGTWSQLPGLRERIENWAKPKLVIDHHLTQEKWADIKLVLTEAAATGEIVAELLGQWDVPLAGPIASALYLAIASDTGWFAFSNTRPFTHRLAATLMEAGVDTDRMYQRIYQNERAHRVALQARALDSLELLAGGRLAVMTLARGDFQSSGASVADTENLINMPLQIGDVEVSMLMVEAPDFGPVRISLRSKGRVDVARFAERFGGGGHARAAGLKIELPLAQAREPVVGGMIDQLRTG